MIVDQTDELVVGRESAPFELGLSDIVKSFQEMLDHMKLVVDNFDSRAMFLEAVTEGLPHVHHRVCNELGAFWAEPFPELL